MLKTLYIPLDTTLDNVVECTKLIKRGDTLTLTIKLFTNGVLANLTGQSIDLILKKSDNTLIESTITTVSNGVITATLSQQATLVQGVVSGEIQVYTTGTLTSTNTFTFEVSSSLADNVLEISQNDIQVLADLRNLIASGQTDIIQYENSVLAIGNTVSAIEALANIKSYIDTNLLALQNANATSTVNIPALKTENDKAPTLTTNLATQNTSATSNISALTTKNADAVTNKTNLDNSNATATTTKTNLDASNATASATKTALDTSNTTANTTKTALNTSNTTATTTKTNLDASNTTALATKSLLDTSNATATTTKTNLDASNATASATKTALDISNTNATTTKSALDTSKTNADTSKSALDTSNTTANTTKTNLDNANTLASANITSMQAFGDISQVSQNIITLQNIEQESTGYGALNINGFGVAQQSTPNMTVNVAGDTIHMANKTRVTPVGNSSLTITSANATNPRKDIIYINTDGSIGYTSGTPSVAPTTPTTPSNAFLLCEVYVGTNVTSITNANITDKRKIKNTTDSNAAQLSENTQDIINHLTEKVTQLVSFSRASSAGSGTQVISHALGKVPKSLIIEACVNASQLRSHGLVDSDLNNACTEYTGATSAMNYVTTYSIVSQPSVGNAISGKITAITATNFTITWDVIGTPNITVAGSILLGTH